MATYTTLNDLFTSIANEIRLKNNNTEVIVADTFPEKIKNMKTSFDYNNQNVTAIPNHAFKSCEYLNSVNCYNLTSVGTGAFENCANFKSIVLYDGVISIGENAFKGCSKLTIYCMFENKPNTWHENWNPDDCEVVWLGGAVETWDISATENDDVTAKLYNDGYNSGKYLLVISGNGNQDIIGYDYAPWRDYENFATAIICNGITNIDGSTFSYCRNLTSITIPNSVNNIGAGAFRGCSSLTSIIIPNSVTNVGSYAFQDCTSLTSIIMPNSITSINAQTFQKCTSLTSISIPDSVTSIGYCAFYNCTNLTSITYTGTVSQWNAITFGDYWNYNTPSYIIHCTDGDIAKDGTILGGGD